MNGDFPHDENSATRTSIGASTLLRKDRLLAERYRIISPIGAGGMGLVYRAHDERLDLDVAIKVLRPERAPDAAMIERFEREIVLAREVSHPNVVRIHDIGQDGDLHFITMDLIEGRSLRDLMEHDGPIDPNVAARIVADIAEGLEAAHRKGVVHRDLKPANILLDENGQAFISDFGIARSLHAAHLTRTGMIVGSPDYLAPEQARGEEIDGRVDIYALGLILYEMLSGDLPFRGGTIEELIAQRTVGKPRELSPSARVPKWLRRIVYRCLHSYPDDRFATAGELAEALRSQSRPGLRLSHATQRKAGIAALILVAVAVAFLVSRFMPSGATGEAVRLAVLPMSNDTGQPELQWLAGGFGDILTMEFSETSDIEFIETSRIGETISDLQLDQGNLNKQAISQLASLLSADRILTGALRADGEGLRIDANLQYGDGGRRQSVIASSTDASPHQLVSLFAGSLREALSVPTIDIDTQHTLSTSSEALEAYTKGRAALRQADTEVAIPLLESAVEADPGFGVAWFYLADAYDHAGYSDRAADAIRQATEQSGDEGTRTGLQIAALAAALGGDYEKSRTLLARLTERFPSDIPARMALAEAYGDEGLFDEAGQLLESVVSTDADHPQAWFLLGKYAIQSGDSRRAIDEYLVRDLVIQNRLGNRQGQANVLNAMGIAYGRLGQIETARENYERAAQLRGEIGDRRGMATSLNNLARLEMMTGNFDAARTSLEQARQLSIDLGDQAGLAAFTNTIGTLEEEAGNYAGALDAFKEALSIRDELGDRRALTESYNNVGFAYYMLGELGNAQIYWERALEESRELANPDAEMQALQSLGLLHAARGEWDQALQGFVTALNIGRELNYPEGEAASLGNMGRIAAQQGRFEAALSQLNEAMQILRPVGDTRGLAEFGLHRAEILSNLGLLEQSREQLTQVRQWLDETPNLEQRADFLRLSSRLDMQTVESPVDVLADALDVARSSGSVAAVMRVRVEQARQAYQDGDLEVAIDAASSVAVDARKTGYATLQLHSLQIQTQATIALEGNTAALPAVNETLKLLDDHVPFANAWHIRAIASEVFGASGDEASSLRQQALAIEELDRLRTNMPVAAVELFNTRAEVTRLLQEALVDGE